MKELLQSEIDSGSSTDKPEQITSCLPTIHSVERESMAASQEEVRALKSEPIRRVRERESLGALLRALCVQVVAGNGRARREYRKHKEPQCQLIRIGAW